MKIFLSIIILFLTLGCEKKEENNEIIIGTGARYKQLDPMISNDIPSLLVTNQIFQTFFNYENGKITSDIIESYQFEDNKLILVPKKNLLFSDGSIVSINDYKKSIDRSLKSPACKFLTGNIKEVKIDKNKLIFILKTATPSLINNLTYPMISLLKETEKGLIGTGSYIVKESSTDFIRLKPNKYSTKKGLNNLKIRFISEDNSRTIALETGEIDLNLNVPPLDKKLLKSKGYIIESFPSVTTEMIWLNNKKIDFELRKYIFNSINKKDIISTSMEGEATIANSVVPKTSFGFIENDIKKSDVQKKLKFNKKINIVVNDANTRKTNAQIIQANLKEVGIESEILILDWGKYLEMSANGEHDILLGGWVTPNYDAEGILKPLFFSEITPSGGRRTFYSNPKFDELLKKSNTYKLKEREMYLKEAQKEIFKTYGIIPLYYPNYNVSYIENLEGFKKDSRGIYNFSDLVKKIDK